MAKKTTKKVVKKKVVKKPATKKTTPTSKTSKKVSKKKTTKKTTTSARTKSHSRAERDANTSKKLSNLAQNIVDSVFAMDSPDGFHVLMGVYGFCFQIYCDFSGYTDIARGVAKLMGFEFMLNFDLPYFATNPSEFWRRWHISLSSWLRDYLYIPLGGSRHGERMTYRNLMLTMVIGGFWHGAAWNFILWGFYHGALLGIHRFFRPQLERIFSASTSAGRFASYVFQVVVFFHFTCYGWLLFRATSFEQIKGMTLALFSPYEAHDPAMLTTVLGYGGLLMAIETVLYLSKKRDFLDFRWMPIEARVVCYSLVAYLCLFRGGQPQSFIYFQF